jgi:outer membrane lipoprotein SlyB
METNKTSNRLHPLIAAAAVSVMLVSLVGVAAITGVLPNSHSSATPSAVPAPAVSAAPIAPIAAPARVATTAPVEVAAWAPTPSVDAKTAANNVVNPQPKRVAAAPAPVRTPAPKTYASRDTSTTQPQPRTYQYAEPTVVAQAPRTCDNCGRIESVQAIQQQAQPSGVGVVAGAVLGGVLGNQVGGGNGKKLATVAGAIGGGFAGNEIEKHSRSATTYQVRVRMDNGTIRTFPYNNQPNWNIGDRIKVVDGYLTSQV